MGLYEERYAKLTPEHRKTADRWMWEKEERTRLLSEMRKPSRTVAVVQVGKLYWQLMLSIASMAGRHIASVHCMGCNEIERILYPESFEDKDE